MKISGIPPDSGRRVRKKATPIGVHPCYREGIPDIFIPPTQNGNAGVISGRNENSGMTTGGRGWIVPVGSATPDRLKVQGRRKVQPRKQGNRNRRAEIVLLMRSCLCRLGNAGRPCAGRGLNPRPESSTPAKYPPAIPKPERHLPEMNLLFDSCFPSVVPLLSRGWIVPVGGATPDRLKAQGRRKVRPRKQGNRNRRAEIVLLMRSCLCRLGNAGRPCAGRGLNPRPE